MQVIKRLTCGIVMSLTLGSAAFAGVSLPHSGVAQSMTQVHPNCNPGWGHGNGGHSNPTGGYTR